MEPLKDDLEIEMDYVLPQQHFKQAEQNNCVVKEHVRATYHSLPYKNIPKVMIKYLAMDCIRKLNYFPVKEGISEYYSPCMIMHQEVLDYNKHYKLPYGSYVQAHIQ